MDHPKAAVKFNYCLGSLSDTLGLAYYAINIQIRKEYVTSSNILLSLGVLIKFEKKHAYA
jgi:hypothetical protein